MLCNKCLLHCVQEYLESLHELHDDWLIHQRKYKTPAPVLVRTVYTLCWYVQCVCTLCWYVQCVPCVCTYSVCVPCISTCCVQQTALYCIRLCNAVFCLCRLSTLTWTCPSCNATLKTSELRSSAATRKLYVWLCSTVRILSSHYCCLRLPISVAVF